MEQVAGDLCGASQDVDANVSCPASLVEGIQRVQLADSNDAPLQESFAVSTRRDVLSGGLVSPRANMRRGGPDSPGERYDVEENTSFRFMDHFVLIKSRLEYRGNGTFYEALIEDVIRTIKVFKKTKGVAALEDAIDGEIQIVHMLQRVYAGFVFLYFKEDMHVDEHRILVYRQCYGNIRRRFEGPAPVSAIRVIMYQLLLALRALELKKIIHFNIRLENIMCARPQGYYVKLRIDHCARHAGSLSGENLPPTEKEARSPEIILGYELPSFSTDVYAAAMAMQRLYWGHYPWFADCRDRSTLLNDNAILQGLNVRVGQISDGLVAASQQKPRVDHFDGKMVKIAEFKKGNIKRKMNMNELDDGEEYFTALCTKMLAYTDRPSAATVMKDTFLKEQFLPKANEYQTRLLHMKRTMQNMVNQLKSQDQ